MNAAMPPGTGLLLSYQEKSWYATVSCQNQPMRAFELPEKRAFNQWECRKVSVLIKGTTNTRYLRILSNANEK